MAIQVDLVKDATIAFLSTSGLLLTLILGLIYPHMSQGMGTDVYAAVAGLITTSILAAWVLFSLAISTKKIQSITVWFFVGEVVAFIFALGALGHAITTLIPPP